MTQDLVRRYYSEQGIREWTRLVRDAYHRLEFDTTIHFLTKYLPKKNGLVLDAGGGPGRYTIELARRGYNVVLLDFSPDMLKIAKRRIKLSRVETRIAQVFEGSIDDLSRFSDESFDVVLCLGGALSHVVDRNRREIASDELVRVAKNKAPIFVSVIGKLAVLVTELTRLPKEIEIKELFEPLRDSGDYYGGYGFAPCHFFVPDELRTSFEKRGLEIMEMVGLEGLASGHSRETNRLFKNHPKAWKTWWETHLRTCTELASVGISEHFLMIARKNF